MRKLLWLLIPALLMAQDRVVTDAQRAAYWRALYEVGAAEADPNAQKKPTTLVIAAAQARAEAAHVRLVAAVVDITRSCGLTDLTIYFDGTGEPACPAK